jgi:hypothetical protein
MGSHDVIPQKIKKTEDKDCPPVRNDLGLRTGGCAVSLQRIDLAVTPPLKTYVEPVLSTEFIVIAYIRC